jgi:hypothetical protein
MKCPDEFILSQYADGEITTFEAEDLAAHLQACRSCRRLAADLKAEKRLLIESLQGVDSSEPMPEAARSERPEFSGMDRLAVISIGVVILMRLGIGLVQNVELPSAVEWLQPWSLSALLNYLVNGLFYVIEKGGSAMTSLIEAAGAVILGGLILGITIAVTRRAIRTKTILGLISLMFLFVVPSYAIEVRKAEKGKFSDVSVAANETLNDTLVAFGDTVSINGTVTGDLIAFARNIEIEGTVQGNVFGFAQRVDVAGKVDGDVFAFGQSVRTDAQIGESFWGFGQTVTIGQGVRLIKDAAVFASNAYINGDIGRDAMIYAATLDAGGRFERDLRFAGAGLMLHGTSAIGRNLNIKVPSEKGLWIDSHVTIGGKKSVEFTKSEASKYRTFGFYTKQALRIGSGFLMGLLLYWLIPAAHRISLSTGRAVLTSGGIGFLAAVAAPIGAIILAITLIGIPVSLLAIAIWILGLYLAKVVVAKCIGSAILGAKDNTLSSILLPLLLGLVIVIIAVNLPYVGGILNFLLVLVGLGSLVRAMYRMRPVGASRA